MQVAGVQPVGARGLAGVQAVVTDAKPAPSTAPANAAGPNVRPGTATVTAEPVVFLRDGIPTDRRPVNLRQQKAAARYKEAARLLRPGHQPRARAKRG